MSRCSNVTFLVVAFSTTLAWAQQTAIDEYVNQPDNTYEWKIVGEKDHGDVTSVVVELTSQTWLTEKEVDRPLWKHWLRIAVPKQIKADASLLMITGGSNDSEPPSDADESTRQIAQATGTITAELKMVPNQALVFHGDGVRRKEDDLIGYTWDQYLKTGEARWLARNAMVKSAVRAMDTIEAFAKQKTDTEVKRFVVAGASKRGWTTWLTGAMDDRVVAIVPIVIDVLNVDISMRHHFAAYGYWAPAVGNYVQHGIMQRLNHPRLKELYNLVDPHAYRHRLDMPKLMLNAAGDQFFLPDSSRFYFDDLPGEKHLRYVANTDHSMDGSDALQTLTAFYFAIAHNVQRPDYTWSVVEGKLRVESRTQPKQVVLWTAQNPETRDFRLETLGPEYKSTALKEVGDGIYEAPLMTPDQGWAAQFVELTYDIGAPVPLKLTTSVYVLPDELPYKDRAPDEAPSVTIKVVTKDTGVAKQLLPQAVALMEAKLKVSDVDTLADDGTFYINWLPREFRSEAGAVIGWLEEQSGITNLSVQLESGRHITATVVTPVP